MRITTKYRYITSVTYYTWLRFYLLLSKQSNSDRAMYNLRSYGKLDVGKMNFYTQIHYTKVEV